MTPDISETDSAFYEQTNSPRQPQLCISLKNAYDGLLAGERLLLALKQLEAAYQEKRGYDYEITKHISLRQLNPLALLQLKATGTCEFAVPEVLFDMDFPGHYMRRIKSVALSVPCVVGPYTSLNCTLRLTEHKFRTSPIANTGDYSERTDETDPRFSTVNVPITSNALSTGQNDSGVFELNFRDERYIPFEGAGAISKWRIELPAKFRQFDYGTIADVVMHVRYTAVDGGDKLKKPAAESFEAYIKSVEELSREEGLFVILDLKHEFPNEWHRFASGTADFVATVKRDHFPYFVQASSIKIAAIQLFAIQGDKVKPATPSPALDLDALTANLNPAAASAFELSLPTDSAVLVRDPKAHVFVLIKYSVG